MNFVGDEYTRLIERDGSNKSISIASTDSHQSDDGIDNYDKRSVT